VPVDAGYVISIYRGVGNKFMGEVRKCNGGRSSEKTKIMNYEANQTK